MGAVSAQLSPVTLSCVDDLDLAGKTIGSLQSGDLAFVGSKRHTTEGPLYYLDVGSTRPVDGVGVLASSATEARWLSVALYNGGSIVPATIYGSFSSTQIQAIPNDGPADTKATFDTIDEASGVQLVLPLPSTEIQVLFDGVYEISVSPDVHLPTGNSANVKFWPVIDGVPLGNSASTLQVGNNTRYALPFVTYVVSLSAFQSISFRFWASGNAVQLQAELATAGPPAIPAQPSIIVVVKRLGALP